MNKRFFFIIVAIGLGLLSVYFLTRQKTSIDYSTNIELLLNPGGNITNNFKQAIDVKKFQFPEDFGSHPEYQTEWWYYTGNVFTDDGRHFGYQLTFFRRAIPFNGGTDSSAWTSNQIYLAHFALTDTLDKEHFYFDEISRGAAGLAGTKTEPYFSIWLKNWEIEQINDNQFNLKAETEEISIDLLLTDNKGIVFHGDQGLSQKGAEEGNASFYFSQTRLDTEGVLRVQDKIFDVSGLSWMDHEFGTSTLGVDQVGWDWFSIQLSDNTEIMLFQIREMDGEISPFSSGTIINEDNSIIPLKTEDFEIQPLKTWRSPDGVGYPTEWKIVINSEDIELSIKPVIPDQEMKLFFQYWEGAVEISGLVNGKEVSGYGYVELTGYAQSMQGVF